ncbi:class I SAM-dependent methyltransferase [Pantoea sp. 18069]|uniref:class I SAM-dependent methyltransferase n=1 Tax=Pantoea sp. 18069 TaxID=2681415 RepID=UPI0013582A3D|nr:class I SAM-dependent methyltransferase [Pantoea sp. 18069]
MDNRSTIPATPAQPGAAGSYAPLSAVPSTLRIPLAARAFGDAMFPALALGDAHAGRILTALGDDGLAWLRDRHSIYGVLARTRRFRELAAQFLAAHPAGHLVNLGCGLSHYFQWLDNGQARMTDADLPEVLAIRRTLLPVAGERHEVLPLDLTVPDWWDRLGLPATRDGAPVFLLCEGVLMYLQPAQVQAILRTFGERAPAGSSFAFDAMCWLAIGRAKQHPSVKHTAAEFHWGPRRLPELTQAHARLRLAGTFHLMEGYGLPYSLIGPTFRMLFGVPFYALYALQTQDIDTA